MKSQVYYSDQEENYEQKNVKERESEESAEYRKEAPFQKKIREFYEQLKAVVDSIPIKDVILFQPLQSKYQAEESQNYEVVNQTLLSFHQEQMNHQSPQQYPKTRSRGVFEPQIQLGSDFHEKSRAARSTPQNKFRYRNLNKRRKVQGPHSNQLKMWMEQGFHEKEVKPVKVNDFSDEETEAGKQQTENGELYREAREYQDQSGYPSGKYQDRYEENYGQTSINEAKLADQFKLIDQLILKKEAENKSCLKVEEGQVKKRIIITRDTIADIFKEASLNIEQAEYQAENGQDPFYYIAFLIIKEDIGYKNSNERSSHHLMKGRLFVVRRIMEIYSGIPPKQHNQDRFIRNRLTKYERQLYNKARLPHPPCRLTSDFLRELFKNASFSIFFKDFVVSGRAKELLMQKSKKQLNNFGRFFKKIALRYGSLQEKRDLLLSQPFPYSYLDVKLFDSQAILVNEKYCKNN